MALQKFSSALHVEGRSRQMACGWVGALWRNSCPGVQDSQAVNPKIPKCSVTLNPKTGLAPRPPPQKLKTPRGSPGNPEALNS